MSSADRSVPFPLAPGAPAHGSEVLAGWYVEVAMGASRDVPLEQWDVLM
jgi:hypothetical protein